MNCTNFIKELSGYSVKIGRPRRFFSCEGCPEASEASAATSMGMILSAKGDRFLNCVNEVTARVVKPAAAEDAAATAPNEQEVTSQEPGAALRKRRSPQMKALPSHAMNRTMKFPRLNTIHIPPLSLLP